MGYRPQAYKESDRTQRLSMHARSVTISCHYRKKWKLYTFQQLLGVLIKYIRFRHLNLLLCL